MASLGHNKYISNLPGSRFCEILECLVWYWNGLLSVMADISCTKKALMNTIDPGLTLRWRHSWRDGVSNHQHQECLINGLFKRRSKETVKLRVTGLCAGTSPVSGEFHAQRVSNVENVSIWWRHHELFLNGIYISAYWVLNTLPTICRRHLQMLYHEWKWLKFDVHVYLWSSMLSY